MVELVGPSHTAAGDTEKGRSFGRRSHEPHRRRAVVGSSGGGGTEGIVLARRSCQWGPTGGGSVAGSLRGWLLLWDPQRHSRCTGQTWALRA